MDTFVEHFIKHMNSKDPHARDVGEIYEFKILWEMNPTNLTKSFGTRNYSLCFQEKLHIVCRSRKCTGGEFLNRRSEIESVCRQITGFHRLRVRGDTQVTIDECMYLFIGTPICKKSL